MWLPYENFSQGEIVIHARGKDIVQGSFIGIAVHAINDSTFDNVYARPFNFRATDSVRRIHAVQYAFEPEFSWQKLRQHQNGRFEKAVISAPAATDWFTMKVLVEKDSIKVHFNNSTTASLVVPKLNKHTSGKIGLTGMNYDIDRIRIYYAN